MARGARASAAGYVVGVGMCVLAACGQRAGSSGGGTPSQDCAPSGTNCSQGSDCCSGSCSGGACSCRDFGSTCGSDTDCCEDFACDQNGRCSLGCRANSSPCTPNGAACCGGACIGGVCGPPRCIDAGGACDTSGNCCDGLGCSLNASGPGTCLATCATQLGACVKSGPGPFCCSGAMCAPDGVCVFTCRGIDLSCSSTNECCDGFACVNGKCSACGGPSATCTTNDDCCAGTCMAGTCSSCQSSGSSCSSDEPCCARLQCVQGSCTCGASSDPCSSDDDCCDGLSCHEGHCEALGCFDTGATPAEGDGIRLVFDDVRPFSCPK
ncbi:MAG: hypothetical protein ACLP1X_33020 [Polyangiaceae bacterium]